MDVATQRPRTRTFAARSWARLLATVLALAAGGAAWFWWAHGPGAGDVPAAGGEKPPAAIIADVVAPKPGGIERQCTQPGTVEPFEAANLYAKVSGFLAAQTVDIGSRVTQGQVLARIWVPEYEKQVERDRAGVSHAQARAKQMVARLTASEAEARAADAAVTQARVTVRAKTAYRRYREKQLARIKGLLDQQAIDARLVDEQEDFYLSAQEDENASREAVNSARERATAARAAIAQASADLDEARAEVGVAEADLERSKVLLDYCVIRSPYAGVVTRRNFLRGDFIRAANAGGTVPLLAVERTDVMRVVIQVPDREVPYVHVGAPAAVEMDALPGRTFRAAVSRFADSEDPATRLMRTEVDVPNPHGTLRRGMYGRATLTLSAGDPKALRVPSAAAFARGDGGKASVRVVRDGKARTVPVTLGADNGIEVEVLAGLSPADRVILRADGPVPDGTTITARDGGAAR